MNFFFKIIFVFCGVCFLVSAALAASFVWDAFLRSPKDNAEEIVFTISEGASAAEISRNLRELNLIPSRLAFRFYARLTSTERGFQPGEFTLQKGMSYAAIVSVLTKTSSNEVTITIPEGWTMKQIAEKLDTAFWPGAGQTWLDTLDDKDWSQTFSFLADAGTQNFASLQGYLFPDTYRVSRQNFPNDLTYKFLTNFGEKLSPGLRVEIFQQGKTIHEIITLASIVEREVASDEERAMVADIFQRRLAAGMALQADSTVNYLTEKNNPSISYSDREIDSPYNTYRYRGLPPGPICNPGLSAIKAVIFPQANDYWYFLTDAEGNTYYAETNDEQNENKARYLIP